MDNVKATIEYYDSNAELYYAETVNADMSHMRSIFMNYVPCGRVLDFGCGSGRDTKSFLGAGYNVDAIDGSIELCKIASENTGLEVRCMTFDMLDAESYYDGIWACSSILHSNKKELNTIFQKNIKCFSCGWLLIRII